jgi:AAA family ATP:ADP antiporter
MANLVLFLVLLETTSGSANAWTGRIFYIWAAVFNLFVVSVFWGFLADVFNSEQSRRLFGFIAAGGTIGGIVGSSLTSALVAHDMNALAKRIQGRIYKGRELRAWVPLMDWK